MAVDYNGDRIFRIRENDKKKRIIVFSLAVLVVLSACRLSQSVSQEPGSSAGAVKKFAYVFEASSNPINLTVTLDTEHGSESMIPVTGRQVQTTGADGTVFSLDIPAGSLDSDTKIEMTPVASISGLPFGGKITYAVQLAPDDLVLNRTAILTITPPQPIALKQQIFFGYAGKGLGLSLATPVVDSKEIKFQLFHFSGYGVTEGAMSEISAVQSQLGSDPLSRIQSLTAQYLAGKRSQLEGGAAVDGALTDTTLEDLINQYEEQVVKPALQAAGNSCEAGKEAIRRLTDLERTRQLLGVNDGSNFGAELTSLVTEAAKVCVQEAYKQCVDQHIIHRMIPLWLDLKRQYEILGGAESGPEPEEVKLAEELTVKCLTFELQFESRGSFDAGGGGGYKSAVKAVVRLQFDPKALIIKGEAPLDNLSFEFMPPEGCTAISTLGGSTFKTKTLEYITDTKSPTDKEGYVRDFRLNYWPGVTSESFHVDCPPQSTSKQEAHYTSPPSGYWSGIFFTLHAQELNANTGDSSGIPGDTGGLPAMPDLSTILNGAEVGALPAFPVPTVPEGGGFVIDSWNVTGDELFATKEWIKDNGAAGVTESGTFKLYHKPGG